MWRENLQQHQKYVFQFIQRTNDKEAPIIFTYSYMAYTYLGKIQANFRLSAVCDLWRGKYFLQGFWTDRIGHVLY